MALSIHDFAELMLAMLAKSSESVFTKDNVQYNIIYIPFNYRERIENILCADNGWKEKFSTLINVDEYFEDHFWWEERLASEIINFAKARKKDISCDIYTEHIIIIFTETEIKEILYRFDTENIKQMRHFTALMVSRIYGRRHKEQIFDHSAKSVAKMKKMNSFINY